MFATHKAANVTIWQQNEKLGAIAKWDCGHLSISRHKAGAAFVSGLVMSMSDHAPVKA